MMHLVRLGAKFARDQVGHIYVIFYDENTRRGARGYAFAGGRNCLSFHSIQFKPPFVTEKCRLGRDDLY